MVRSMSPTSLLGCRVHLRLLRLTASGARLALDDDATDDDVILLPTVELPADADPRLLKSKPSVEFVVSVVACEPEPRWLSRSTPGPGTPCGW